jgi:hypothetical protein
MSPGRLQALQIPDSTVTITTKIIDLTTISGSSANNLYYPPIEGVEHIRPVPSLSFLLEHPSGQKLLFDLGVPKDITVLGPEVADRLKKVGHHIEVEKDVVEVLEENNIKRDEINAVIWRCVKHVGVIPSRSCNHTFRYKADSQITVILTGITRATLHCFLQRPP